MGHPIIHPTPWMILPFAVLLLSIALGPLLFAKGWQRCYPIVVAALAVLPVAYYVIGLNAVAPVLSAGHHFASFILLIGSLYVVSGGMHIAVRGEATPIKNTAFLFIGAVLSNFIGTTGASMLLIRAWIRMNKYRVTAHHVVFFIFIVSNVGGCLTPIGDPPLFLGYLECIPFWWVGRQGWHIWLFGVTWLLAVFYYLDRVNFLKSPAPVRQQVAGTERFNIEGLINIFFLLVILVAVFVERPAFLREALMAAAAVGSWFATPKRTHEANHFDFHPIKEVTILFAGIFATMLPALDWLKANAGQFGQPTTTFYYWGTGTLSAFLDNAPTYLSFLNAAMGASSAPRLMEAQQLIHSGQISPDAIRMAMVLSDARLSQIVLGISFASVFFGAFTYIGNGPNFLVKSIAERQKVHTPGFAGYIVRYAIPYLLPMLVAAWLLFFRG